MNAQTQQVLNSALALPDAERAALIEALKASLPEDVPPFDDSWREVIRRRWADLESGVATTSTWEDVKRRARTSKLSHEEAQLTRRV